MNPTKLNISPIELDSQSHIRIDKWLDLNSSECKEKDPNHFLTKKFLKIGIEDNFLFTDQLGRVWGKGKNNNYYPFHFNIGKTLYGIRLSNTAAN